MKLFQAAAVAGALVLAANTAHAGLISIGLQQAGVNGGAITTQGASSARTIAVASVMYGSFDVNQVSAFGTTDPGSLFSNAINASSIAAGTINVFVTEQGVTQPTVAANFLSAFTANLVPAGWTITEKTFLDAANGLYTTTTNMANATFTSNGVNNQTHSFVIGAGPYSLTEEYTITATTAGGTTNNTIDLTTVPEPGTLAILGAGLIGLGFIRRRGVSFRK